MLRGPVPAGYVGRFRRAAWGGPGHAAWVRPRWRESGCKVTRSRPGEWLRPVLPDFGRRGSEISPDGPSERPSSAPGACEVWCYTDRLSYALGDQAHFHFSATAETFSLRIVRDGPPPETVFRRDGLTAAPSRRRPTRTRPAAAGPPDSRS